jgi:ABC-type glycerol-3-phosphate transport system substrate-binding protein
MARQKLRHGRSMAEARCAGGSRGLPPPASCPSLPQSLDELVVAAKAARAAADEDNAALRQAADEVGGMHAGWRWVVASMTWGGVHDGTMTMGGGVHGWSMGWRP